MNNRIVLIGVGILIAIVTAACSQSGTDTAINGSVPAPTAQQPSALDGLDTVALSDTVENTTTNLDAAATLPVGNTLLSAFILKDVRDEARRLAIRWDHHASLAEDQAMMGNLLLMAEQLRLLADGASLYVDAYGEQDHASIGKGVDTINAAVFGIQARADKITDLIVQPGA